ncbi:MAG: glycoside hydrolase family 43 protein [Acidimicrobiales bacterium]
MFSVRRLCLLAPVALLVAVLGVRAPGATAQVEARYQNPVHAEDFADPFVLRSGNLWFAYSTHRGLANIQILSSTDLVRWQSVGTALPFLPSWAEGPYVWAPAVLARPGRHVLFYAVRERASGRFCVSAATSEAGPQGPFFDRSTGPLVCQRDRGGTIDPSAFTRRDGRAFLLFKSEGIAGREPTRLWSAPLDAAGLHLAGRAVELLHTEQPWEEPIIENPAMAYAGGRYFLFYSANRWDTAAYATGYAVCDSPLGPCGRPAQPRVLRSANGAAGPGGADFFTDADGDPWIAYHAWSAPRVGYPAGGSRSLRIDRVAFAGGRPWIAGPSTDVRTFAFRPGPPASSPGRTAPTSPPPAPAPPHGAAPSAPPTVAPTAAASGPASAPAAGPAEPQTVLPDGAPAVVLSDLDDRSGAASDGTGSAPRAPARGGPVALAALLAASVGVAGARELRRGSRSPSSPNGGSPVAPSG